MKYTILKVISDYVDNISNNCIKKRNGNMYNVLKISILQMMKEEIWNPVHDVFLCREYNLDKWMICSLILSRKGSIGFPENTYFTGHNVSVSGGK